MVDTTYANIVDNAQTTVRDLLANDSTVTSYSPKVVDGTPEPLTKGVGFPIVIVHTPDIKGTPYALSTEKVMVYFDIEVWGQKESVVRLLTDAVRNALSVGSTTSDGVKLFDYINSSTSLGIASFPDGTPVYTNTVTVEYQWVGVPS